MESLPYKTIYPKRFDQPDPAELMRQARTGNKIDPLEIEPEPIPVTSNDLLSASGFSQKSLPDIEKIKQVAVNLSNYYSIDVDIRNYSDSVIAVFWMPFSLYEDVGKQMIAYLISQAQSVSFQADTNNPYRFILSFEYSG